MKTIRWCVLFIAFIACAHTAVGAPQEIPSLSGAVVDTTKWLTQQEKIALEKEIKDVVRASKAQIAILIVDSVQPETIEQYSIRVAESWKIGKKGQDTGVIILIARSDRKVRIEVGYGLEGLLTDLKCRRIIDETIAPRLKDGKPYDGLHAGIEAISAVLAKDATDTKNAPGETKNADDEITIPYFDELNMGGKTVAVILGIIGGIFLLAGVYAMEGWLLLAGLLIPSIGAFLIALLVNITMCFLVAVVACVIAVVVAFGVGVGGLMVGGGFGGGGASGGW